jgi:hypothetical protein
VGRGALSARLTGSLRLDYCGGIDSLEDGIKEVPGTLHGARLCLQSCGIEIEGWGGTSVGLNFDWRFHSTVTFDLTMVYRQYNPSIED